MQRQGGFTVYTPTRPPCFCRVGAEADNLTYHMVAGRLAVFQAGPNYCRQIKIYDGW